MSTENNDKKVPLLVGFNAEKNNYSVDRIERRRM